jgi:hypothetical protein
MDLRTETFAFSRQESGVAQYMVFHNNELIPLGTNSDSTPVSAVVYSNSFYSYQGDERNYSSAEEAINSVTGQLEDIYKVNTRLGQYSLTQTAPLFAPIPDQFGLEVSVDSGALITGRLLSGSTFNLLTGVPDRSLSTVLNRDLTGVTVYPIHVR